MKTYQPKAQEVKRDWHSIDARGKVLGRLSTKIATLLMGKHKPTYSTHMDMGDHVVVTNAKDVVLTGNKLKQKVYRKHSNYPGGLKEVKVEKLMKERPTRIIRLAVERMLPKNRLQDVRMARLKTYSDDKHPYSNMFKEEK